MSAILFEILRHIGVTGCVIIGFLGWYEGIPGLRDIPFVEDIPVVREFVAGRVKSASAQAAKDAVKGLVSEAELTEANARADEFQRQMEFNSNMARAAAQSATKARADADAAQAELEKRIAADNDPDLSRWRPLDLERWMRK